MGQPQVAYDYDRRAWLTLHATASDGTRYWKVTKCGHPADNPYAPCYACGHAGETVRHHSSIH